MPTFIQLVTPADWRFSMKRVALSVLLWGVMGASLHAYTYPQFPLGAGYECVIIVTNKLQTAFTGAMLLREGNNQAWSVPYKVDGQPGPVGEWIYVNLPPLGSAKYVLQSDGPLHVGYLLFAGSGNNTDADAAVAFFYNYYSGGHLVDSTGIPDSRPSRGYFFPVEKSATVDTGFAWSGPATAPTFDATVTLVNAAGTQVQQKTVTFNGHTAQFFTQIFDNVPNGFVGHVRIVCPAQQSLSVAVLRLDLATLQLTSTPATMFSLM